MEYSSLHIVEPAKKPQKEGDDDCGPTYRVAHAKDGATPLDVSTCYDSFRVSVEKYPDRPCLGYRPIKDGVAEPFLFYSYKEVEEKVAKLAAAFVKYGLQRGSRVGVYGPNCPEWMFAMQACNRQAYVCVPLYDSLGEDAVEYEVEHGEVEVIVSAINNLALTEQAVQKSQGKVKAVVYWGEPKQDAIDAVKKHAPVYSLDEALAMGEANPVSPDPPKPDDISTIMYTSGTTGVPKGVVLQHQAILACIQGLLDYCEVQGLKLDENDRFLSYLPLAHIFDRTAEEMYLHIGARIGYWQGNIKELLDDLGALKPTIFIGVPRVFDRIRQRTLERISASTLKRLIFNFAYHFKHGLMAQGGAHNCSPTMDALVFNKTKAAMGGAVRVVISGGAPLSAEVEEFLRVTMCCPVGQGYGLSETCAASFIGSLDNWDQVGTVGLPLSCQEFRLRSVPEMGYLANADPPQGEVLLRGGNKFQEYFKMPQKTAEDHDADGFFCTGDVGEIRPDGALKIIDRKKHIFKLSQGEYIAVEKLEGVYKLSDVVNQVWVYGNSFESSVIAVVVPVESKLMAWAQTQKKEGSFEEICKLPEARAFVLDKLKKTAAEQKIKGFEVVKAVFLDPVEWLNGTEVMTPSYKLVRNKLQKKYQAQIDDMYAALKK